MKSLHLLTELVDKCIGSRIHIVMKTDKEIVGTLLGFDDFVSILRKMCVCVCVCVFFVVIHFDIAIFPVLVLNLRFQTWCWRT